MIHSKKEGFHPLKLDFNFLNMEFYLHGKKKAISAAV